MKTFIEILKALFGIVLFLLGAVGFFMAIPSIEFGLNYTMMQNPQLTWAKVFTDLPSDRWWLIAFSFAFTGIYTAQDLLRRGMESAGIKKRKLQKEEEDDSSADDVLQRYFLVAYTAEIKNAYTFIHGNIFFGFQGFPSNEWLKIQATKKIEEGVVQSIVISTIYEFNSKHDFLAFQIKSEK